MASFTDSGLMVSDADDQISFAEQLDASLQLRKLCVLALYFNLRGFQYTSGNQNR